MREYLLYVEDIELLTHTFIDYGYVIPSHLKQELNVAQARESILADNELPVAKLRAKHNRLPIRISQDEVEEILYNPFLPARLKGIFLN